MHEGEEQHGSPPSDFSFATEKKKKANACKFSPTVGFSFAGEGL
jgi:hypothetical protein